MFNNETFSDTHPHHFSPDVLCGAGCSLTDVAQLLFVPPSDIKDISHKPYLLYV